MTQAAGGQKLCSWGRWLAATCSSDGGASLGRGPLLAPLYPRPAYHQLGEERCGVQSAAEWAAMQNRVWLAGEGILVGLEPMLSVKSSARVGPESQPACTMVDVLASDASRKTPWKYDGMH